MAASSALRSADIDEKAIRKENPEELVVALAHAKADAILEKMQNNGMMKEILDSQDTTLMITADQKPSFLLHLNDVKSWHSTIVFTELVPE
ncbi:hypothetical protein Zm00014a_004758 [Zea mays]|uniref:Uncharacterized protein n=1 Tax=Zea mays TaxID=4577 RepID=A0A317YHS3_MAIZE|nr:hypothetical protein Zm00014a_004758 [Zea mays]